MQRLYKIPEACEIAGVGITKLKEEIAAGRITAVRIGRAVRVPSTALDEWIENLIQESGATR